MADLARRARSALAGRLREARRATGLTGAQFAERLGAGWDQPKVSRVETGRHIPTIGELEAWASEAGISLEELTTMRDRATAEYATFANRYTESGGAAQYQDMIGAAEAAATRIGQYEPILVPGILQTAGYAREMLRLDGGPVTYGATEDDISHMIAARLRRQAILHEPGRSITLVVGEAALRMRLASPAQMRAQCEHVAQLAVSLTTATIGVLPFLAQVPVAALTGWSILDDLVTVETDGGELQIADPAEVDRYWRYTSQLLAVSLTGSQAAELCRRIAAEMS